MQGKRRVSIVIAMNFDTCGREGPQDGMEGESTNETQREAFPEIRCAVEL